jgi:hypothetical protein
MECGAIFDAALVLKLVNEATTTQAEQLVTRIVGMLTKMCHFGGAGHTKSTPTATATFPDEGHDHAHDYEPRSRSRSAARNLLSLRCCGVRTLVLVTDPKSPR